MVLQEQRNMPLPCPLLQQKKISATKDSSRLQLTTRSMRPGVCITMIYLVGPGSQQRRGSHRGGHRQRDATCPSQSTKRARQRKAGGHKSSSWLGNVMLASLCYTLSGGISLKGNLEKQEHQRRKGETKEIMFTSGIAESGPRPLLRDKRQVVGHTGHCLLTMTLRWDLRGSSILQDQTSML